MLISQFKCTTAKKNLMFYQLSKVLQQEVGLIKCNFILLYLLFLLWKIPLKKRKYFICYWKIIFNSLTVKSIPS